MTTTVISVRVKKKVREVLEKEGVDIAGEVMRFLEELAERIMTKKYVER